MPIAISTPPSVFHRFRIITYLLIVLSVAGFSYAENNTPLLAMTLAAAVMSWLLVESRPRNSGLPRAVINIGVLVVAAVLFTELVFSAVPNLLLSLGHFMTGILICKMFERKTVRDFGQILTLTLLVMVAGAIFSASLTFAIVLILYLGLGLYAILLLHLHAETEAAREASLLSVVAVSPTQTRSIRKDLRRVAMTSSLLLIGVAAVVFLAIPRTRGQGIFQSSWSTEGSFRTGFTDHVRFSDYGSLQQSDAIVMEVKLDQDGTNAGSEFYQPYFRGLALDNYDSEERQWSASIRGGRMGRFRDGADEEPWSVEHLEAEPGDVAELAKPSDYETIGSVTQQYTMHTTSTGNTLFTISPAVSFTPDRSVRVDYNPRDFSLVAQDTPVQPMHYTVTSAMIFKSQPKEPLFVEAGDLGVSNMYDWFGARRSKVPAEITTLTRSVVQEMLPADGKLDQQHMRAVADRICEYLRDNYRYSLSFAAKDRSLDPTADFLLNRKEGHCEYFASAMVMMCRSMGLNARMVTGYHGGDFNSISGTYIVRQKHAHAWAEVYLPSRGWTLYDPSPIANDSENMSIVTKWISDISEVIQKAWQTTIIAFDNSSRMYIFSTLQSFFGWLGAGIHATVSDFLEGVKDLFISGTSWTTRITGAVTLLVICALATWLIRHLHRRRTSQLNFILRNVDRKVQRQLAHELLFFDELLRLLARTGSRKRIDQTPREYVETLAPALRNAAPEARWLIGTFYDVRFGTFRVSAAIRMQIATALRHVRDQLHKPPTP